jgi:membrane associated rhomboid family serine protease
MLPIRDDQPRFATPYVTYFLIVLNLLIFFLEWSLEVSNPDGLKALVFQFGVVPSHLTSFFSGSPRYPLPVVAIPFLTSMFLHGSWMHVIGNMWFLHIFGDNVEDYLGHFKYLAFYLLAGILAMLTQFMVNPNSGAPTLGASGAIAGVLGAYFILYPRARVLTWFFVFVLWIPAWIILGYWFVLQFLSGTATALTYDGHNMGGVAFWAHVGGFISGVMLIKLFPARSRRSPYAMRG